MHLEVKMAKKVANKVFTSKQARSKVPLLFLEVTRDILDNVNQQTRYGSFIWRL